MTFRIASIALVALSALGLASCGKPTPICDNQVIRQATSPDGAMKAVLFRRACGGPTGFSSQVSVFGASEAVIGKGNALIADTDGGHAVAAEWGGPDVTLEWTAPRALTVTFAYLSRVIVHESPVRGVDVTYQSARE